MQGYVTQTTQLAIISKMISTSPTTPATIISHHQHSIAEPQNFEVNLFSDETCIVGLLNAISEL